jgi:deazaflavin-dependent oxidoreductase (nitroreductase family)
LFLFLSSFCGWPELESGSALRDEEARMARMRIALMVIASNGGSCSHPAWYYNLRAHPEVVVELGNERFRVVAEELDFEARSSVWPTIVEQSPAAGEFQRAITRSIPVFVLTRED